MKAFLKIYTIITDIWDTRKSLDYTSGGHSRTIDRLEKLRLEGIQELEKLEDEIKFLRSFYL